MKPVPSPPEPPEVPRQAVLVPKRMVGIGILALLPILALAGILANHQIERTSTGRDLEVRVAFPDRLRYFTEQPLDVEVRNTGDSPMKRAQVTIDRAYLLGFTDAKFLPDPDEVTQEKVVFDLGDIPARQSRRVQIELTALRYGPQVGKVRVAAGEAQAEIDVRTFVLP